MRMPDTEEEKELMARILIRQGYGGRMSEMFLNLCNWAMEDPHLLIDLAKVFLLSTDWVSPSEEWFFRVVRTSPMLFKDPSEATPNKRDLTSLGAHLLDHALERKIAVWSRKDNNKRQISSLSDRELLDLFQYEKIRCYGYQPSLDLCFMAAEGIRRRPNLENRLFRI